MNQRGIVPTLIRAGRSPTLSRGARCPTVVSGMVPKVIGGGASHTNLSGDGPH